MPRRRAQCCPSDTQAAGQVRRDYAVDETPGGQGAPEDVDMSLLAGHRRRRRRRPWRRRRCGCQSPWPGSGQQASPCRARAGLVPPRPAPPRPDWLTGPLAENRQVACGEPGCHRSDLLSDPLFRSSARSHAPHSRVQTRSPTRSSTAGSSTTKATHPAPPRPAVMTKPAAQLLQPAGEAAPAPPVMSPAPAQGTGAEEFSGQ